MSPLLARYAKEVAIYWGLSPDIQFINDPKQDAQLFDFSSRTETKRSICVEQTGASQLLVFVLGDALIEPFWPVSILSFF